MNKTKHRKLDRVKGNVLIVGMDVSKAKHDAAMRLPGGVVLKTLSLTNDLAGFEKLWQEVQRCCERYKLRGAILGIEPTGHYWEALAYWWEDQSGTVVLVNPMHTKKSKELEDNSPLKTERKMGLWLPIWYRKENILNAICPEEFLRNCATWCSSEIGVRTTGPRL